MSTTWEDQKTHEQLDDVGVSFGDDMQPIDIQRVTQSEDEWMEQQPTGAAVAWGIVFGIVIMAVLIANTCFQVTK